MQDRREARRIDAALDALETLRDGGDASVHFADLIEREPENTLKVQLDFG